MSEYGPFMKESIDTLDRILGKECSQGSGPQDQGSGPQDQGSKDSEGSNINDLTNLFHFLLLDKVDVKIRDKLTAVYKIFRSKTIPQSGPPQSGPPQLGPPQHP